MGAGRVLVVSVTASGSGSGLSLAWPSGSVSGGVSVSASLGVLQVDSLAGVTSYSRTSTATLGCSADGTARVVTSLGGTDAHAGVVDVDCLPLVDIVGLDDASGRRTSSDAGAVSVSEAFSVSPASATCTAARAPGVSASLSFPDSTGSSRTVAASVSAASGAVAVTVTCSATGHASTSETVTLTLHPAVRDACLTVLGSLGAGTVVRPGEIVVDSGCVSWKLGTFAAPHYARRFALGVVSASSSAVDVYVYVLEGSGSSAVVVGSDDDSGSGTDALVSGVSLEPGRSYVVEVTTAAPRDTGAFTLSVAVVPDQATVGIFGLGDASVQGAVGATVTVRDSFTVAPAAAACTATGTTGTPTITDGTRPEDRTVTVRLAAGTASTVTVTCTHAGLPDGVATARLTAAPTPQIGDVTVSATTGGTCTKSAAALPDGIDAVYACTATHRDALHLSVTADANTDGPTLAWTADTAITVDNPTQSTNTAQILAPESSLPAWRRTGTAQLVCTAAGTATLRVALTGASAHVTRLDVACEAPSAQTCSEDLGSLGAGVTRRTGTIAADAACTSAQRRASTSASVYYARRYTFSLASATTITIDLGSAATNERNLDTYLLLLRGTNGSNSEFVRRNDDGGTGKNSRIAAIRLAAGSYTIEATTFRNKKTGDYTLAVTGPPVPDTVEIAAVNGGTCTESAQSPPTGIDTLWDCEMAAGGRLVVLANARSSARGFAHSWTASGGVAVVGTPVVLAGHEPDEADTAYRQASRATLGCTADGAAEVAVTFGVGSAASSRTVRLVVDCEPVTSLSVRAVAGGSCEAAAAPPAGADAGYGCVMAPGRQFEAAADASATAAQLDVTWTVTGGVTLTGRSPGVATPSFGFGAATTYHRTATATLACTRAGTATATVTLPGATAMTALLTVSCLDAVQITGLEDTSDTGTGALDVADEFTVAPATAACTPTAGTVTPGAPATPATRTLTVPLTAPDSEQVTVTCTATGRARTLRTVTFAAVEACSETTAGLGSCQADGVADQIPGRAGQSGSAHQIPA